MGVVLMTFLRWAGLIWSLSLVGSAAFADDWTAITIARGGAWGFASREIRSSAIAQAIENCLKLNGKPLGCGATLVTTKGSWVIAADCGVDVTIGSGETISEARDAIREKELQLKYIYGHAAASCNLVAIINDKGKRISRSEYDQASAAEDERPPR
jgi:hypothetical protein